MHHAGIIDRKEKLVMPDQVWLVLLRPVNAAVYLFEEFIPLILELADSNRLGTLQVKNN